MIYTLFVWTVVAVSNGNTHHDWRPIAQVEPRYQSERDDDAMLAKCAGIARELNIARERYRCIKTK